MGRQSIPDSLVVSLTAMVRIKGKGLAATISDPEIQMLWDFSEILVISLLE